MGAQPLDVGKVACEFTLIEETVDLKVANPMHAYRLAATFTLGHEMMAVDIAPITERATAERTEIILAHYSHDPIWNDSKMVLVTATLPIIDLDLGTEKSAG